MRIPSLSRRTEPATTDDGPDGRGPAGTGPDGRGPAGDAGPTVTDRTGEQATYRSGGTDDRPPAAERRAAERAAVARAATNRPGDDPRRGDLRDGRNPTLERTLDGRTTDLDASAARARTTDAPTAATTTADRPRTADRDGTAELPAADRTTAADRTATTAVTDRDRAVDRDGDGVPDQPVVAGPRPRASLLATLGLVVGVAGVLFVLTGTLAGYGIGLGAVGAVLAVLGMIATRRRHVAGKTDALLGIAAGLGAVVLGVLAMTGQFDWPTTDGDWVARFREWLDSQFVDRL